MLLMAVYFRIWSHGVVGGLLNLVIGSQVDPDPLWYRNASGKIFAHRPIGHRHELGKRNLQDNADALLPNTDRWGHDQRCNDQRCEEIL